MNYGLNPKTEDKRDIRMGVLFSPTPLADLPSDYEVEIPIEFRKAQEFEDNCAPTAGSIASSLQEGTLQDGVYTGGMGRQAAGYDTQAWGMEMRDMANAFVKYGSLNMADKPDNLTDWHDISGWDIDGLLKKSIPQKKNSYVWVDDRINLDMYDSLRVALFTANRGKTKPDTVILIGTRWPYDTTADIPAWQDGGQGHCYIFSGWKNGKMALSKVERGITVGTWGVQYGDQGKFYIAREVFNKEVPTYGALFFLDETPEKLREYIQKGVKLDDNIILLRIKNTLEKLVDLYRQLLRQIKSQPQNYIAGIPPYKWDTPENARHSVRVIGDEEGLTWTEKDIICACIQQESGFNNAAICRNKNKQGVVTSSDWGIVQCNDFWWIGQGKLFPSVEYVVNNPDIMVRWMIKRYKQGHLNWWVSYSSGAYKKYMP